MADLTKAEIKRNLTNLQTKMETNPRARAAFLKDPAATLKGTGVTLSPQRVREINAFVEKQIKTPGAKVSAPRIRQGATVNDVEVNLIISVKF